MKIIEVTNANNTNEKIAINMDCQFVLFDILPHPGNILGRTQIILASHLSFNVAETKEEILGMLKD